jgi:predicted dehydrogenase/threonine dehydrogenase-like Zn-dependent dehydrogenase
MKQLLHRFDTGDLRIVDVPTPVLSPVQVLAQTRASLISAGTERMLLSFGRSSLLAKARNEPDKVRQVLDKARTDGIASTFQAVRAKLQDPTTLGYCSAGVVVDVGVRVGGFAIGDRIVTNAPHGDHALAPHTLAARIPHGVDFETAAFTPLAAIALQGIRLAHPTIGETVVVYGLGLVGLLAVQLLKANGCRVIGIDRDAARLALAETAGADTINNGPGSDAVAIVLSATGGVGADAVLLTLSSDSDDPAHEACRMSRKRGRLVLVGVTGLKLRREDFYEKELSFQVSCSYGPGRYDPIYEGDAIDYPIGFVRWSEQRNFEAVLQLMAEGKLDASSLVTHRFPFERAADAYDLVVDGNGSLGVVLQYPEQVGASSTVSRTVRVSPVHRVRNGPGDDHQRARVAGIIGAGSFAQRTLLPLIQRTGFQVRAIASAGGTSAVLAAERFGVEVATTTADGILIDDQIGTVFIVTRHDSHARLALQALAAGKHVFVEKPLALNHDDLDALERSVGTSTGLLTVGFNRRFAPMTEELKHCIGDRAGSAAVIMTVNAGQLPLDHWTRDSLSGGGRIAGEACHFIDLARALIGRPIVERSVLPPMSNHQADDTSHISLVFEDGSTASIHYLTNGARGFPKERIEVFVDGRTLAIDNWRKLRRYGPGSPFFMRKHRQDKGHAAELKAWYDAVAAAVHPPIPYDVLFEVSRETLHLAGVPVPH